MAAPGQMELEIRWCNNKGKGESEGCGYYGRPLYDEQESD